MNNDMPELDFSGAKRAADVPQLARIQKENKGKEHITIRLDADVLAWFRSQVAGGGNYQTLINEALRAYMHERDGSLERTLRRVIREELHVI
ncbi:MAG: CopG family transcriptional regulator [Rhodanobacter sp.]|nr:MAG: CopG family transcriptional regulator [Rhodanobacter sp.]TAM03618.1 MAG: CopG family transcriptional regulator [Rhodanobacter sp.]TAM39030.1 MAG: CopG family transcriptional regulator [Rhodanobacter sp.]